MVKKADLEYLLAKYLATLQLSGGQVTISGGSIPHIYNVTMVNANQEYSQALPANMKKFMIKIRSEDATFRVAWETGHVASSVAPYLTVLDGGIYSEDMVYPASATVFFACGSSGKVMEIVVWA